MPIALRMNMVRIVFIALIMSQFETAFADRMSGGSGVAVPPGDAVNFVPSPVGNTRPTARPDGFVPPQTYNPNAAPTGGQGGPVRIQVKEKRPKRKPDFAKITQAIQTLQNILPLDEAMEKLGVSYKQYGDDTPENTNWETYTYPDKHRFYYGGVGAGNIGDGLCSAKNKDKTQMRNGYCEMLSEVLNTPGTCANNKLQEIMAAAESNNLGDFENYCSNYASLPSTAKPLVFQQILAGLIVKESGWRPDAREPAWTKSNGQAMGGMGLFQIGVRDQSHPDCGAINQSSILDAETNIRCGACIALTNLAKDKTMGHGTGDSGARGMARYFGPFRDRQSKKREDIAASVNTWCRSSLPVSDSVTPGVIDPGSAGAVN